MVLIHFVGGDMTVLDVDIKKFDETINNFPNIKFIGCEKKHVSIDKITYFEEFKEMEGVKNERPN